MSRNHPVCDCKQRVTRAREYSQNAKRCIVAAICKTRGMPHIFRLFATVTCTPGPLLYSYLSFSSLATWNTLANYPVDNQGNHDCMPMWLFGLDRTVSRLPPWPWRHSQSVPSPGTAFGNQPKPCTNHVIPGSTIYHSTCEIFSVQNEENPTPKSPEMKNSRSVGFES